MQNVDYAFQSLSVRPRDDSRDAPCTLCENSYSRWDVGYFRWWWARDNFVDGVYWWRICHSCAMSVWDEDTDSLQAAQERAASWTAIILERLRVSGKRHVSKKVRAA